MADLNLAKMLQPVPRHARFDLDGWFVWCGTICRTPDGQYALLFSRWPAETTFRGWVTHSEICVALSDSPTGPFVYHDLVLPGAGGEAWDAHVTHNPAVLAWEGNYYLYYTGNRGDGEFWNHRNNQRVGVAVATDPHGPWQRFDCPLVEVNKHSWDFMITTNPTVCRSGGARSSPPHGGQPEPSPPEGADERFLMLYKTVAPGALPFGGDVYHAAAFADSPLGPFERLPEPIFTCEGVKFPAEDPCVWHQHGRYYAVVKDMQGCFTEHGPGLVLFQSENGADWRLARHPFVSARQIAWEDGEVQPVALLDRPQVYVEDGQPRVLSCAVKPDEGTTLTYNIQIPLE